MQKEKVLNLFGFLMDLLDEPTETKETVKLEEEKTTSAVGQTSGFKTLKIHESPHTVLYPNTLDSLRKADYDKTAKGLSKLESAIPRSLELIKQMSVIDKERAQELMEKRLVNKVTRPYIQEMEDLKNKAINHAAESKEIESIIDEVGEKLGITLVDGKVKLIQVSSELRDNIPLEEESNVDMGVSVKKDDKYKEIKDLDELLKEVREKLELKDSLKDSKMLEVIKESMMTAPATPVKSIIKKKSKTKKTTKRTPKK